MSKKKAEQLGMNPGTATYRLTKDLLFDFVQKAGIKCHHCGGDLTRDTFSIEHKIPWVNSNDPKGLFFGLENISYSHLACNMAAARKIPRGTAHGTTNRYNKYGCRCDECRAWKARHNARFKTPEKRRAYYERTGK